MTPLVKIRKAVANHTWDCVWHNTEAMSWIFAVDHTKVAVFSASPVGWLDSSLLIMTEGAVVL